MEPWRAGKRLTFHLYEREASELITAARNATESTIHRVRQKAQQHVQAEDNVAIRRLQETLEEQREHFQARLRQAHLGPVCLRGNSSRATQASQPAEA